MFAPARINEILNTLNNSFNRKLIEELNDIQVESIDFNIDFTKLNSNYIYFLGVCYEEGRATTINFNKAFELYKLAHERNNMYATYNLAVCYEHEIGTSINYNKSFELYKLAHQAGHIDSTNNLAVCYCTEKGTSINYNTAFELFTLVYDSGHEAVRYNLANCYSNGLGTTRNIIKAIDLYIQLNKIEKIKNINILNTEYTQILDYLKHIKNPEIIDILSTKIPSNIIFIYLNSQIQNLHTLKDLGMYNTLSDKIMKYAY